MMIMDDLMRKTTASPQSFLMYYGPDTCASIQYLQHNSLSRSWPSNGFYRISAAARQSFISHTHPNTNPSPGGRITVDNDGDVSGVGRYVKALSFFVFLPLQPIHLWISGSGRTETDSSSASKCACRAQTMLRAPHARRFEFPKSFTPSGLS